VLPDLIKAANAIKSVPPIAPQQPDMGPVITAAHRDRRAQPPRTASRKRQAHRRRRGVKVSDAPKGFYLGATVVDGVQNNMTPRPRGSFRPRAERHAHGPTSTPPSEQANKSAFGNGARDHSRTAAAPRASSRCA